MLLYFNEFSDTLFLVVYCYCSMHQEVTIFSSSSFSVRIPKPLVTRSTLEIIIPDHAVPKLVTKSKNKLAQISEVSRLCFRELMD